MKAKRGDWLVEAGGRRGQVLAVKHDDGRPPFLVRWRDTGHETLVFPGSDAHIVTAEEETARRRTG